MKPKEKVLSWDSQVLRHEIEQFLGAPWCAVSFKKFKYNDNLERRSLEKSASLSIKGELYESFEHMKVPKEDRLQSLSHSFGVVCGVGIRPSFVNRFFVGGFGVDCEPTDRQMSPRLVDRITHDEEKSLALDPIARWVVKEACFKSHPQNQSMAVTDFVIREISGLEGEVRTFEWRASCLRDTELLFFFKVFEVENYFLSVAVAQSIS